MKIEYLQCFQEVVKFKSFSKAATSLYISQSSLSKKIKALEDLLGGALFVRKKNSTVSLTAFGEYIAHYIDIMMDDYAILLSATDDFRINQMHKLSIATYLNIAHSGLLRPITTFEHTIDNFYIETMEMSHTALKQNLANHQVEIAFGYQEILGTHDGYDIIPLYSDPVILITSREYAAKHKWGSQISLSQTKNAHFCFPREDMELFSYFMNLCRSNGFTPRLTNSDVRLGTIREYISAGMRCTLMFESISRSKFYGKDYGDKFEFIHLNEAPKLTMCLYTDRHDRKIRKQFVDYIMDYLGKQDILTL